jgi:hypothetical protein
MQSTAEQLSYANDMILSALPVHFSASSVPSAV